MSETVIIDLEARFTDGTHSGMERTVRNVDRLSESVRGSQRLLDRLGRTRAMATVDIRDNASTRLSRIVNTTTSLASRTVRFSVGLMDYATRPLRNMLNMATSLKGIMLTVGTGYAANKLIASPIGLADQYSNAFIGFETLFKSAERAQQMMNDIDAFAKETPFNTSNVINQAQRMMAMGWDAERIIPDLNTIGNAASATGKGDEGLGRIILALSQIKTKGKLSAEELNQLAEAGINAKGYLAAGLGYGNDDAGMMAFTKDQENGKIGANQAIDVILEGLKEYDGMMQTLSKETVAGIKSNIADTFEISIFRKWGMGLQEGAKRGFGAFADFLDDNNERLDKLGDKLHDMGAMLSNNLADAAESGMQKILSVTESSAFNQADLGGKLSMLWQEVIGDPLGQWWSASGKRKAEALAAEIGSALAKGVVDAFSSGGIMGVMGGAVKGLVMDASTLLPGGEKRSDSALLSTALLGFGAYKLGGKNLLSKLSGGARGAGSAVLAEGAASHATRVVNAANQADDYAAWWARQNPFNMTTRGNVIGQHQEAWRAQTRAVNTAAKMEQFLDDSVLKLLKSMGKLTPYLEKAKGALKGNWLNLLFAGFAVAQADDKMGEAVKQGGGLAGGWAGAKAGAALGMMTGNPIAVGVGGVVGGISGYTGGDWLTRKIMGDFDLSAFITGTVDGTRGLARMNKELSSTKSATQKIAEDYQRINDLLWDYHYYSQMDMGNKTVEEREAIQIRINDTVKELADFYPNLISQYDIENGKLSANYATLKDISRLDRERSRYELSTAIDTQEKQLNKKDVAGRLENSNDRLRAYQEEVKSYDEVIVKLYTYQAEIEKLNRLKDQAKRTGDEVGYTNYSSQIASVVQESNALTVGFGVKAKLSGSDYGRGIDTMLAKEQEVINRITAEYQTNDQLKQSYDELFAAKKALIEIDLGSSIEEAAKKYQAMNAEQKKTFDEALKAVLNLQSEMGLLTDKRINLSVIREDMGYSNTHTEQLGGSVKIGDQTYMAYANGDILSRAHLAMVAEDGPEAIIPLSSKRRARGLALWQKAGELLGIPMHAEGGVMGKVSRNRVLKTIPAKQSPLEDASTAAGIGSSIWERAENMAKVGQSSNALYRVYMRDAIEKSVPSILKHSAHAAGKLLTKTIYATTKGFGALAKRVPRLGDVLQIGGVILDTANEQEDKLRAFISGAGGFLGQIAGGAAGSAVTGMLLGGATTANPLGVAAGGILGGILGAIGGEEITDRLYGYLFDRHASAKFSRYNYHRLGKLRRHAQGGIFTEAHSGLVAESGAEAIIPLQGLNRNRGKALWAMTGQLLGMNPKTQPSFIQPNINLGGLNINVTLPNNGKVDGNDVMIALEKELPHIANELCQQIMIGIKQLNGNVMEVTS